MTSNIVDFNEERMNLGDYMVRGIAAHGQVRAFGLTARDTVQKARELHGTSPVVTAALGRLMMGALMTGMMFKEPDELITFIVRGDGPIKALTVTANCEGQVKGFAANPDIWIDLKDTGKLDVGGAIGKGTLSAVRDIPGEEPCSSIIELVNGEIGDDLTSYFMTSDQVPTSVGVGVLVGRDTNVEQAGGFIVQLMPDCPDEVAELIEHNLEGIVSVTDMLACGNKPEDILQTVLEGLEFQELDKQPVEFFCGCNEERAIRTVLSLGTDELQELIDAGQPAEVLCEFCGSDYRIPVSMLQELVENMGA